MNFKNNGFTVIELLFAIIIIGMLMTIAIAVFQSHLKSGRDSFRKSNIDTAATLVRLDRLKKQTNAFDLSRAEVLDILRENSMYTIVPDNGKHYFYGYSENGQQFFVVVCGEDDQFYVEGTPLGVISVRSKDSKTVCDGTSVPIKERMASLNPNADETNLDNYIVYKLQ